ncbi:MAG: glycosyltransferase [Syntrophales bacterium]
MIERYTPFVGKGDVEEIKKLAASIRGIKVLHVNSTRIGGGVAEILYRLVPLMNDIGIETEWQVMKGDEKFFRVTKKIHNLLHLPSAESLDSADILTFLDYTYRNFEAINTEPFDVVFIHDPQPVGLIVKKKKDQKWIWRCHIDLSTPTESVWNFIKTFSSGYGASIFHISEFVPEHMSVPAFIIPPSIDPLHDKNRDLDSDSVNAVLRKYGIDLSRPLIVQISRFDRLKDPLGAIKAYRLVKKSFDCQLTLAGSFAADDPEASQVLSEIREEAAGDNDIFILNLPPDSHVEINALQRSATVVVQKSIREGFGLVVAEAMWKGKPVIGSYVGGIRRQIINGLTGFFVYSTEGTAHRIKELIINKGLLAAMGENAREQVRHNFLITRHLKDYLMVIKSMMK